MTEPAEPPPRQDPPGEPAAPPEPAPVAPPPTTFDLPGARRVVGAGIQLAIASASDIRRASIYIGLLALASLGPTVVFLIAMIDRFDLDVEAIFEDMISGSGIYFLQHGELVGPLLLLEALFVAGGVLVFALSFDAQTIGIAMLAGHAATRPVRLPEAITRARQVFWRMVGGGILVGVYSTVIQLVLELVLGGLDGTNPLLSFAVAMIATIATVPFAYMATGIVLGDVGPIEALNRSTRLFRARPSVALVVVLFTLVTSAIETFALGAGLDLVGRVGELLGVDAAAGGAALVLAVILSLAAVTAFGSLLFTIAALVSAPQVAAFLGLTFYDAGLARARVDGERPPGFRWVTRPMQAAFVVLAVGVVLGVPTMAFGPRPAASSPADSALVAFLDDAASRAGADITVRGEVLRAEDPPGDQFGGSTPSADIILAEYVVLETVPDWLLDDVFRCGTGSSVCGSPDEARWAYEDGGLLFMERLARGPDVRDRGVSGNWGPLLAVDGFSAIPALSDTYLAGVTDSFLTRIGGGVATIHHWGTEGTESGEYETYARSAWIGPDLLTLIPLVEIPTEPLAWDAYAALDFSQRHDSLRPSAGGPMRRFVYPATVDFKPLERDAARS